MIEFVHTGDIHLGLQFKTVSFDKEKAKIRREELWSSFQRIVDYSREKKKDFLLIAGDLYEDKYFNLGHIKRLRDILKSAPDVNIIIAAGNHDYLGAKSLYKKIEWSPNVHIFDNEGINYKEFLDLKTIVYGYSWDSLEIRGEFPLDGLDEGKEGYKKILVLHGDIASNSNYLALDLRKLRALNMDYIALGHIHKPEIFDQRIAYCGSPEPLDFGESGIRGFIEGQIGDGRTKIELVPFSKRNFHQVKLDLSPEMSHQNIVDRIVKLAIGNREMDFYRISLSGYIDKHIDMEGILDSVKEEFYYLEIRNLTRPDYDLEELEIINENNIIAMFIREMRARDLEKPEVRQSLYIGLDVLLRGIEE